MPNYIYMGHGDDIVLKDAVTQERNYDLRTVPPGCVYVTIAKTGLNSSLVSVMNLIKINLSRETRPYLDDPVLHYNKLSMLAAGYDKTAADPVLSLNDLHLKREGEEFINNACDFVFSFDHGHLKYLYKSGLYDMSKTMTSYLPTYKHNNEHPTFNHTIQHKFVIDTRVGIDFKTIKAIYKDSLFPTSKAIVKELKTVMGIRSRPPKRASSAPNRTSRSSASRTKSTSKSKKSYNNVELDLDLDSTLIPYSTFVTAVKKIVKGETGFSLMEKFPGNHYNFVCRAISQHIEPEKMILRRAQSNNRANRNGNRAEYIGHKRANPILNFRSFLERFMTDDTRMTFGKTRLTISYKFLFEHLTSMLTSYLTSATPRYNLILTIDHFIEDLNRAIGSGEFTMKEVPDEVIRKLSEIIDGKPPLMNEEPYIFHRLV